MKTMNIKRFFRMITAFIYWAIFIVLIFVAGLVAVSALNIPGSYKLYVVESGSMEPAIKTGSISVVKPASSYNKGDIITAYDLRVKSQTFTHRISSLKEQDGETLYETKGDANQSPEPQLTKSNDVLGKVLFSVPFVGYAVSYAKTQAGFILLVIIPATLIIYSELMSIKNEAKKLIEKRKTKKLTLSEKIEEKIGEEMLEAEAEVKKDVEMVEEELKKEFAPKKNKKVKKSKKKKK